VVGSLLAPLDLLKTGAQVSGRRISSQFAVIRERRGWIGLYDGAWARIWQLGPQSMIMFTGYELMKYLCIKTLPPDEIEIIS